MPEILNCFPRLNSVRTPGFLDRLPTQHSPGLLASVRKTPTIPLTPRTTSSCDIGGRIRQPLRKRRNGAFNTSSQGVVPRSPDSGRAALPGITTGPRSSALPSILRRRLNSGFTSSRPCS